MAGGEGFAEDEMFDLSQPAPLKGAGGSRGEQSQTEEITQHRRPEALVGCSAISVRNGRKPTRMESREHLLYVSVALM